MDYDTKLSYSEMVRLTGLEPLLAHALDTYEHVGLDWYRGFGMWQAVVNDRKAYGYTAVEALRAAVANVEDHR